jgi:hypothetical protein
LSHWAVAFANCSPTRPPLRHFIFRATDEHLFGASVDISFRLHGVAANDRHMVVDGSVDVDALLRIMRGLETLR